MRYMQCRCGKLTSWTTMGSPECVACPECGVTLAEGPNGHAEPKPHDWREEWKVDPQTGERWQERVCLRCMERERVAPTPRPEVDRGAA